MTLPTVRRSIVIHGHFYQPPREDPWTDLLEREASAAPYHDWNERIEHECYRAVLAARIIGADGAIRRIINTLAWISFNVGSTLMEWLEREAPDTYRGILTADRVSMDRLSGHGNAIAMPYHHIILPLASRSDKVAEVRWGLTDFRRRFGRTATGMWLSETALDDETLDVLAAEGIAFTIVAPHQVRKVPPNGQPGLYRTKNGRTIALFPYDGGISHDVAFGNLTRNADAWAQRLLSGPDPSTHPPAVRAVATDGETFGHHHRFADMALAAAIERLQRLPNVLLENFSSILARYPAETPVEIVEPSSWSCAHGVERWRADCGCRIKPDTSQHWRAPLRRAMNWLNVQLQAIYEKEGARFFKDPWETRIAYGTVGAPTDLPQRARELLELARDAERMFSSCGWFFDEVDDLGTAQILKYAARAIELSGDASRLEAGFQEQLVDPEATSTDPLTLQEAFVRAKPRFTGEARVAAGFAATGALCPDRCQHVIGAFLVGAAQDGSIQTQHRRTGQLKRFRTTVRRTPDFGVEVDLEGDTSPLTLRLDHLPERERSLAREVIRREAHREVLSPEQLMALAHGSITYQAALRDAIIRLTPRPNLEWREEHEARLVKAIDLATIEQLPLPFDAQTMFYRFLVSLPPDQRRRHALATRKFGISREVITVGE